MNFANKIQSICILGGTGFVGRHLISKLAQYPYPITVLSRHPERHRDLAVIPNLKLIGADCHDVKILQQHFADADTVINLIGILNEKGDNGKGFQKAHVALAESIAHACDTRDVAHLLHFSALKANTTKGRSYYLQSKGEGEEIIKAAASNQLDVTTFQPSVMFGPGDKFFNRFAQLVRMPLGLIPLACPNSKMAPVYIGDVVDAVEKCLHNRNLLNNTFTLCGPETYTLKQLIQFTAKTCNHRRLVWGLGKILSKLQARVLEILPGQLMSRDNYRSLQIDNVCDFNSLETLGIEPHRIESIVPLYLNSINFRSRYNDYRRDYL